MIQAVIPVRVGWCEDAYPKMMFGQLGTDVLCCIATQFTNRHLALHRTSKRKKLSIQAMYVSLCILLNNTTYIRHVGSEIRRFHFRRHLALHRFRFQIYWQSLQTWYIRKHHCFRFGNEVRCSVFFENRSYSCITGFLICEGPLTMWSTPTFHKLKLSSSGEVVFPEMLKESIIMPVYNHGTV